MKKILLLLICAFFLCTNGFPESISPVDSLKNVLVKAKDKDKVDVLNNLSWELKYENTDEAFRYSKEALSLAEQLKYVKGKAVACKNLAALNTLTNNAGEALRYANLGIANAKAWGDDFTLAKLFNIKGLVLEDKGEFSTAIDLFKSSFRLFEKIGDQTEMAGLLNNLAVLYSKINENHLSLETYIRVIKIEEKAGNPMGLGRTYNNIAGIYLSMNDRKSAESYFARGLKFSRLAKSERFEAAALNGLGLIKLDILQYDSAITYLEEAAALNRKNGYIQWLANNFVNLGNAYLFGLKEERKGQQYIYHAASLYESISDWNSYVTSLNVLSDWYLQKGDLSKVASFLKQSGKYVDNSCTENVKRDYYTLNYKYFKHQGKYGKALWYLEQSEILDDSIEAHQQIQKSLELTAKYNLSKQQQENEKLQYQGSMNEATIRHQKIFIFATVIITILLIIIILLVFQSKRKIRNANLALRESSREIQEKATALQLANESKDKFLSIISHDLKNPISAITGLSDLLLDPELELSEEDRRKYLKYINDGCLSADQLLENLMKWVRTQTGKMEMKPQQFDLLDPVNSAMALVQNAAIRKRISIDSSVAKDTFVFADPEMIRTTLINLLSNAVKFTPTEGHIHIKPEVNGSKVSVSVSDTGVGISEENIRKLFRLDTKVGTMGTANEKGTGLGLLLVKEFVEKNNGTVSVQSLPGEGSTFTITIPTKEIVDADQA